MEGIIVRFWVKDVRQWGHQEKVNEAVFYGGPLLMKVPINAQGEGDII